MNTGIEVAIYIIVGTFVVTTLVGLAVFLVMFKDIRSEMRPTRSRVNITRNYFDRR